MKNLRINRLGLLEKTIIELKKKGISSVEEIRTYLIETYKISVSHSILIKRIHDLSF